MGPLWINDVRPRGDAQVLSRWVTKHTNPSQTQRAYVLYISVDTASVGTTENCVCGMLQGGRNKGIPFVSIKRPRDAGVQAHYHYAAKLVQKCSGAVCDTVSDSVYDKRIGFTMWLAQG